MGNRAHVIFTDGTNISPAIYLHWNGGPDSVYPILAETERRMGGRFGDVEYSAARFTQAFGDFFDNEEQGGLSLGLVNGPKTITPEALKPFDHGDNGVFVVTFVGARADGPTVRRFVSGYGADDGLRELDELAVRRERDEADASDYREGIAAIFEAMRPKVGAE